MIELSYFFFVLFHIFKLIFNSVNLVKNHFSIFKYIRFSFNSILLEIYLCPAPICTGCSVSLFWNYLLVTCLPHHSVLPFITHVPVCDFLFLSIDCFLFLNASKRQNISYNQKNCMKSKFCECYMFKNMLIISPYLINMFEFIENSGTEFLT